MPINTKIHIYSTFSLPQSTVLIQNSVTNQSKLNTTESSIQHYNPSAQEKKKSAPPQTTQTDNIKPIFPSFPQTKPIDTHYKVSAFGPSNSESK